MGRLSRSVARPAFVFGPHDYTQRFDYWIDRIATHDRVLVPGDGDNIVHHVSVEDGANTLRIVAEEGTLGEAYNVGARQRNSRWSLRPQGAIEASE